MKLDERGLVALILAHRRDSLGGDSGELSSERAKAMDHYHGRPYGTEVEGRSQVVSRDLAETVDWALPAIIRAFVQSGALGEFVPVGPEDEQLAQQESDYTNRVMMQDNPGFLVLHDAVKDAMLLKNGYVKHFWQTGEEVSTESYTGMTLDQLTRLMTDLQDKKAEVEIKGASSETCVVPGVGPVEYFDVKLQITRKVGRLIWMAAPTEEVRVSRKCRGSLQDSPFTEHVTKKTRSDLIEMGMDRAFVDGLPAYNSNENDQEVLARDSILNETDEVGVATYADHSTDEIQYCEAYIRVDYDDDGIAELRKVVTVAGNRIPPGDQWNEEIEAVPLTGFVMKRVPHRHVGESLDDELADLQEIKTALMRQLQDNVYLTNNSEKVINERCNVKDFLSTTPGGLKRVKGEGPVGDAWENISTQPVFDKILPVIDYWDKTKQIRTGIRPGADMDPDVLQEVTKGAYLENLNRLSQKIEMITRMLAETGVREAFLQCHGILVRHQDIPKMVQLRGKWVEVNPQEWRERTDLTVKVGLGTGNEEEKRQKLMLLAQLQFQLAQAAGMMPPAVYAKMYALFEDLAKTLGVEMPEKYALAPNSPEYQQLQQAKAQQPNPEMLKVQAQEASKQHQAQLQAQVDTNRQEMEARQQEARMQMEMALERARMNMELQFEREKVAMQAKLDVFLAQMNNEAKLDAAQIAAQTTLTAQQEKASDDAIGGQD